MEMKQVVQASCLVRTATAPLVAAILPHIPVDEALDRLRALPFVSAGPHGPLVYDAVRGPVTAALKSRDPARYQEYRRAASQVVRDQFSRLRALTIGAARRTWFTCSKNENLREGFFPTTEILVSVEPARADNWPAISSIIREFDGSESRQALEQWWHYHPDSFFVVRDEHGGVQAF